jgi:hypothetical protein
LELLSLLLLVSSQVAMACQTFQWQKEHGEISFRCFCETYSVADYIAGSSDETGTIGPWFWLFGCSCLMLVIGVAADLASPVGHSVAPLPDRDYYWPIL